MDKTTQERIKADAEAYATGIGDFYRKMGALFGYIAGATAENERAQVLVDAMEKAIATLKEGNKEREINFSEWCAFNYQRDFEPLDASLPINERKYRQFWIDNNGDEFTTEQLWNEWNKQNT